MNSKVVLFFCRNPEVDLTPPTNFFENLSIELKMGGIRELYVIEHLKKNAMKKNIFSRRYRLSNFFFTVFWGNSQNFLKDFPQSSDDLLPEILKISEKTVKKKFERRYLREKIFFYIAVFF